MEVAQAEATGGGGGKRRRPCRARFAARLVPGDGIQRERATEGEIRGQKWHL